MTQPNTGSIQSVHRICSLTAIAAMVLAACLVTTTLCLAQQPAGVAAVTPAAVAPGAVTLGAVAAKAVSSTGVTPTAAASHAKTPAKAAPTNPRGANGPVWAELTPTQQQSLKPLQGTWNTLSEAHKRKWLAMSVNYPKMAAPEQARVHSRMTEWAALSAKQRSEARLNFAEVGQHSTDEKQAKWQAYQQLSPEEKQKLAADRPKAQGAAPVVKPVPPQKLAVVPRVKNDLKQHPAIAGASGKLDHNTLLPQALPLPAGAPVQTN
jgi:hypothetical protein